MGLALCFAAVPFFGVRSAIIRLHQLEKLPARFSIGQEAAARLYFPSKDRVWRNIERRGLNCDITPLHLSKNAAAVSVHHHSDMCLGL